MSEVRALISRLVDAGLDPIEAAEIITRAAIAGVAEAGRSAGAVRQERYRHNKASQTVTSDVGDASPLRQESPHTPKETQPLSQKENTPLRGVQKKGERLPDDFEPDVEWAVSQGLFGSETEAAKFADYWRGKAGRDACKVDWAATWRNWVRTALERQPTARGSPRKPTLADGFAEFARFAGAKNGQGPEDDFGSAQPAIPHLSRVSNG